MKNILLVDSSHYAMLCYFSSKKFLEEKYTEKKKEMRRSLQYIDPEEQKEEFERLLFQIEDETAKDLYLIDGFKKTWHVRLIELVCQNNYDGILFCSEGGSWRKQLYPEYKSNREPKLNLKTKKLENKFGSPEQEKRFFEAMDSCIDDITSLIPTIKRLRVKMAEGDDCIAVFVKYAKEKLPNANITILSRDKDYVQLLKHGNCKIYDAQNRKYIESNNPDYDLTVKILCGDASDNIKSVRPGYGKVKAMNLYNKGNLNELLCDEDSKQRYNLNRQLVDFEFIPKHIEENIKKEIDKLFEKNHIIKNVRNLHDYYIRNGIFRNDDYRFQKFYDILKNPFFGNLS